MRPVIPLGIAMNGCGEMPVWSGARYYTYCGMALAVCYIGVGMGPGILLDKSPFQKCPRVLLPELFRHYSLVVPPILLKEVLEDHAESPQRFFALAKRLDFMDLAINVGFQRMLRGDLMGCAVPMDGRPCVEGATISTAEGLLRVLREAPEAEALHRWQNGEISGEECEAAVRWQKAADTFDMEAFKAHVRTTAEGLPKFRKNEGDTIADVAGFVDKLLAVSNQAQLRELSLVEFGEEFRARVRERWAREKPESLRAFAPYAHFCLRLRYVFAFGLANGYLSTHHNSLLDLEYLYYLPFCHIFCSDDKKLHNVLQHVLLRADQTFLEYATLEKALKETWFFFGQLPDGGMKKWLETKGHYPPRGSLVTREMYNRHWKVPGGGERNLAKKLPKELVDAVGRKVRAARAELGERVPHRLTVSDPSEPVGVEGR